MHLLQPIPALALFLVACQSMETPPAEHPPWSGELQTWGTLREALRDGQDGARVAVSDVARDGVWGVGALEGLRGEITIADGDVWITKGDAEAPATTSARTVEANATVLFTGEVAEWQELTVEEPVDPSVLDAFLAEQARSVGLDPDRPFPFVVEGELSHLNMHVIAGECPIRARMMDATMSSPPYELRMPSIRGRLVGIYAPDSAGVVCHMGSSSHVHVILDDPRLTGHVETVGLAAGSTLKLPRP